MGISFDGTDDSAQTGANYGDNDLCSISFWWRWPSSVTTQDYQYALMLQESILFYFFSTGGTTHQLLGRVRVGGTWYNFMNTGLITKDVWHHYAVTSDSITGLYPTIGYFNNVQQLTNNGQRDNRATGRILSIGDNLNAGTNGALSMAELAIWDGYLLDATDRSDLQDTQPDKISQSATSNTYLSGYWPMVDSINYDTYGENFVEDSGSGITMLGAGDHPPVTLYTRPTDVAYDWSLVVA